MNLATTNKRSAVLLAAPFVAITACVALACGFIAPECAHAASAVNKQLFFYGTSYIAGQGTPVEHKNTSKTVTAYDVTGDKKKDRVTFKVQGFDSYGQNFSKVKCFVNGKRAATFHEKQSWGEWTFFEATIKLLKPKGARPFLAVYLTTDNGDGLHAVYQYRNGKFKRLLSQKSLSKKVYSRWFSAKAKGSKIVVTHRWNDHAIGITAAKFIYKIKGGTLARTSKKASSLSYHNMDTNTNGHPVVTAAKSFTVYKEPGLKHAKTTITTGTRLRIVSMRVQGSGIAYKVKTLGGVSGWFAPPAQYEYIAGTRGSWFEELGGVA